MSENNWRKQENHGSDIKEFKNRAQSIGPTYKCNVGRPAGNRDRGKELAGSILTTKNKTDNLWGAHSHNRGWDVSFFHLIKRSGGVECI